MTAPDDWILKILEVPKLLNIATPPFGIIAKQIIT
ncbi:hypothetical protein Kole_1162 [Kosmotoga olearia TBF 19.5.1]|jgi:hypothetical protein|uniref:Uncharacterized protein n=1 Tax=Kosmotoga olearia (strain ATCC BAA-1733 / DSM 21960 / TBF 19.5.1) TaxID=521045 RepID=C5CIJ9_KOSOT|nr:hypothetical protein Kole_1162 [Kosmotoga olearia TBF 19.5.1]